MMVFQLYKKIEKKIITWFHLFMLYKPRPTGRSVFWGAHQDTFVSASKSVNGQLTQTDSLADSRLIYFFSSYWVVVITCRRQS